MSTLTPVAEIAAFRRPTDLGRRFAEGRATVAPTLVMLCGEVERFDGAPVAIRHVLGERWNYQEMMRGSIGEENAA